jgi:hypothetical protein
MKIVRTSAPSKPQTWRPIKCFEQPAPNPPPVDHPTVRSSNEVAAHAVLIASSPGGISPKQQVY